LLLPNHTCKFSICIYKNTKLRIYNLYFFIKQEASLLTFHINDDLNNYYLSIPPSNSIYNQIYNQSSTLIDELLIEEKSVDETNPIKSIKSAALNNGFEGSKPAIFLRYKDKSSEYIRIYPGLFKYWSQFD
jgi:hypothetical protein